MWIVCISIKLDFFVKYYSHKMVVTSQITAAYSDVRE